MESFMEVVTFEGEGGLGAEENSLQEEGRAWQGFGSTVSSGDHIYTNVIAIIVSMHLQLYSYQNTRESPNVVHTYLLRGLCSQ